MRSDNLMAKFFTNDELKDLAKIVDFFESQMCKSEGKNQSSKDCYKGFVEKDSTLYMKGSFHTFIDYKEQKNLYKNIDSIFFNDLWFEGEETRFYGEEKPYKYNSYSLKIYDSKYFKFVKEISNENKIVSEYIESVEIANDFSSHSPLVFLSYYYNRYNFKDVKIRLIYAFYYLNINESYINRYNQSYKKRNKN